MNHPDNFTVLLDRYENGNTAVRLIADGETYAMLSVNTGVRLPEGEFVAKTYAENAGLLEQVVAAGLVEETRRLVRVGLAGPQPVCRMK